MNDPDSFEDIEFITIAEGEIGERLDKTLATRFKDAKSRTYFQYLFEEGKILVKGQPVKKQYKPKAQEAIEIHFALSPEIKLEPENIPLSIIYEDDALIVIDKPPGMVVHPAPGNWSGTLVNALLYYCKGLKEEFSKEPIRPGVIHRLDKETSGVIIAAKSTLVHQRLVEMFSSRQVVKEYIAICVGNPGRAIINAPIGRDPVHRKQMAVTETGKEAITEFETTASDGKLSLVKVLLKTGRTHQIRVHMQMRKTPILGDSVYGSLSMNKKYNVKRQLLHAHRLSLLHPITKKPMTFIAKLPADMQELAAKIAGI